MSISSTRFDLSLFISCSVSLILISLFILIDLDKFNQTGISSENDYRYQRDQKDGNQLEDIEPSFTIDCYRIDTHTGAIVEPQLNQENLEMIAHYLKNNDPQLSNEITRILKIREACGYVKSNLQIDVRGQQIGVPTPSIAESIKSYVNLRHRLQSVSKSSVLEVRM